MTSCSVIDCDRAPKAKGYCPMHWQRVQTTGDPHKVGPRGRHAHPQNDYRSDPAARLWGKVAVGEAGACWSFTGSRTLDGYGQLCDYRSGRPVNVYAHRLAYESTGAIIPAGYQVDHLCFNPTCCNPAHLEAVTPKENKRRARVVRDERSGQFRSMQEAS